MKKPLLSGFTLIEILVSTALVVVITGFLMAILSQTSTIWSRSRGKVEQFRESRAAFETLTLRLSQATLNTYWDYDAPEKPTKYLRRSELRFTSGQADKLLTPDGENRRIGHCVFFHAPAGFTGITPTASKEGYRGLESLLNVWGYFLEYGSDEKLRPGFVNDANVPLRWRFRLMEFVVPTENMVTYNVASGFDQQRKVSALTYNKTTWFTGPLKEADKPSQDGGAAVHVLGENIIALILTPRLPKAEEKDLPGGGTPDLSPLAPNYEYDSSPNVAGDSRYTDGRTNPLNQLPPVVQVTMVAIDEDSALRLNLNSGSSDLFKIAAKQQFRDTRKYSAELRMNPESAEDDSLERELISRRVAYRIFTSNVPIRAAKWSRAQTN